MNDENLKKSHPDKCQTCFQVSWCMLLPSQRSLCLGPFRDNEDALEKYRASCEAEDAAERAEADKSLEKFIRRSKVEDYQINRMLCDLLLSEDRSKDDE